MTSGRRGDFWQAGLTWVTHAQERSVEPAPASTPWRSNGPPRRALGISVVDPTRPPPSASWCRVRHQNVTSGPLIGLRDARARSRRPGLLADSTCKHSNRRRGGDSNPRYLLRGITVFETAAFNRSATSPRAGEIVADWGARVPPGRVAARRRRAPVSLESARARAPTQRSSLCGVAYRRCWKKARISVADSLASRPERTST